MNHEGQVKRRREVVHLRDKKHLSFTVIAEQLKLSEATVRRVYEREPKKSGRPLGTIVHTELKLDPVRVRAERRAVAKAFDNLGKWDRLYIAKRLGIKKQTLHNAMSESSPWSRLGKERMHELAILFREMAANIVQISYDLDRAAQKAHPTMGGIE